VFKVFSVHENHLGKKSMPTFDVPVQVGELGHAREGFDAAPAVVAQEVDGRGVHDLDGESEQEVELLGVDLLVDGQDEEAHLRGEDELVLLEKAARRVNECGVGDRVDEIQHALLDLVRWVGLLDRLAEDDL
jgi:hypothetical protein